MRTRSWIPLVAVVLAFPLAYAHAVANPLPANGYGHSIYDVHETLTVTQGSTFAVLIGGGAFVPWDSLVLVTAGVMNRMPGSDISESAYFRLTHLGVVLEEGVMSPLSHLFQTRLDSAGPDNPQLFIGNDHPFDLFIDYRAFVIAPPTAFDHFALYLPFLAPALVGAVAWFGFSLAKGRQSGLSA